MGNKSLSRREFLRRSAVAGAGVAAGLHGLTFETVRVLAAPGQQTTTLRVVSGQDITEIEVREAIAKMYQEVNPNVEIEIMLITGSRDESQTVMLAGGNPPDVLYLNPWFQYIFAQKGVLLPLDAYIEADNYTFDGISPVAVEACRYNEQMLSMPFEVSPAGFVFNKNLFDAAGVPYPPMDWQAEDWTWDNLIETATKLTNEEERQFGVHFENWMYPTLLYQHGAQVYSNIKQITADTRCVIDSPEAAQAFQLLRDLRETYKVAPSSTAVQELGGFDRFMSGKVAMFSYGRWLNTFRTITDFEWDVAPFPHVKDRDPACTLYMLNYSIYSGSPNADIAWDFLKFLLTQSPQEANVATGMAVAALESVNSSPAFLDSMPPEHNIVYSDALKWAHPEPILDANFDSVLNPHLDAIFNNTTDDIPGTLAQAAADVNAALDQWRADNGVT